MPKSTLWATTTPAASKIPISDGDGKLANGWLAANLAAIAVLANAAGVLTNDGVGGLTWSGSSPGLNRYEPATNGDAVTPEIYFSSEGDVVMLVAT